MPYRRGFVASFIEDVQSSGRLTFREEDIPARDDAVTAVPAALRRLQVAGKIRRIAKRSGLFVIVPPEFRAHGVPPVDWWLDDFMAYLGIPYYVGHLTAAKWHGSSHYAVMEMQVVVPAQRKPILLGRTKIRFFVSDRVTKTPTEKRNNLWGKIAVSTPAATLADLSEQRHFGPDRLAMIARDLAAKLTQSDILLTLEAAGSMPTAQRLGFLLENVGARKPASWVGRWIGEKPKRVVPLDSSAPTTHRVDSRWLVDINTDLAESE